MALLLQDGTALLLQDGGDLLLQADSASAGPTIDTQPSAESVTVGDEASFTVAATTSGGALSYQWYETTAGLISGETSATLDFTTVLADDGNGYYCAVSDDNGTTNSSTASLAVASALTVSTNPGDSTVLAGATATFICLGAGGTGTITYQWFDDTDASLGGETSATLDFTAAKTDNGKGYYCAISDDLTTVYTVTARLYVNTVLVVDTQPASDSVEAPNSATFSVAYTGDGPFTVTWYDPNGVMVGETGDSVTFPAAPWLAGNYYATIADSTGQSVTTNNAVLTVTTPAVVISDPVSISVARTGLARFDVSANGYGPIALQWYETGVGAIAGETGHTFQIDRVSAADSTRSFYCIASDEYATTDTSATAVLTVVDVTLDDQTTPRAAQDPHPAKRAAHRHTDFSGLIRAAKAGEKPYYDTYRFSGRTFQDREE